MQLEKFLRAPDGSKNWAELQMAMLFLMMPPTLVLSLLFCLRLEWYFSIYCSGLISYVILAAFEVLGDRKSITATMFIVRKRERIKSVILVCLGSFVMFASSGMAFHGKELFQVFFLMFMGGSFMLTIVVRLKRTEFE